MNEGPVVRNGTLGDNAAQVVSLLGKPTSFLLFLFAVLVLFELSAYYKTERLVGVLTKTMEGIETDRSREVAQQQQLVSDLIDILEYSSGARESTSQTDRGGPQ